MDIKGKVAVITGGASGLGAATVEKIVEKGGKAVILDRDEEKGLALQSRYSDSVLFAKTDVTDADSVHAAIESAVAAFGRIDICVNCAGMGPPQKLLDRDNRHTDLAHFQRVISINLIGTFTVLAAAAEKMAANDPSEPDGERGVIINTASIAAFDGQIGQAAYAASKGGVVSLALPLARELSRQGIRVMTIAPGYIHTPLFNGLPDAAIDSLKATVQYPKRLGQPVEYANLAAHIIENPYLNGEVIRMDAATRMPPK